MNMLKKEFDLYRKFETIRPGLEAQFRSQMPYGGGDAEDLIATAFAFAAQELLKSDREVTLADLKRLIYWKAKCGLKDAYRAARREHGRKSVRATIYLDEGPEEEEFRANPLDTLAFHDNFARRNDWREDLKMDVLEIGIDRILKTASPRERKIFRERFFRRRDVETLAAKYHTSTSYIAKTCSQIRRRIFDSAQEIRDLYAAAG